jgi:hypothetical protein
MPNSIPLHLYRATIREHASTWNIRVLAKHATDAHYQASRAYQHSGGRVADIACVVPSHFGPQLWHALDPIECRACAGQGGDHAPIMRIGGRTVPRHDSEASEWEHRPCGECEGRARVRCGGCDESAVVYVEGWPCCAGCARHEVSERARRVSEPLPVEAAP